MFLFRKRKEHVSKEKLKTHFESMAARGELVEGGKRERKRGKGLARGRYVFWKRKKRKRSRSSRLSFFDSAPLFFIAITAPCRLDSIFHPRDGTRLISHSIGRYETDRRGRVYGRAREREGGS